MKYTIPCAATACLCLALPGCVREGVTPPTPAGAGPAIIDPALPPDQAQELPRAPEKTPSTQRAIEQYGQTDTALGHYVIGLAYYKSREYADAVKHFEWSLRLDPKQPGALFFLGFANRGMGNMSAAEDAFRKLVRFDIPASDKAKVQSEIAAIRLGNGDRAGALAAYEKATALDPKQFTAAFQVGLLLAKSGDYEMALKGLTGYASKCESKQDRAKILSAIGEIWEKRSDNRADRRKSMSFYEEALKFEVSDLTA